MQPESVDQLLARLRECNVPVSIAQRLQIQRVLDLFPDRRGPGDLRALLTPILAASAEEQERIRDLIAPASPVAAARRDGPTKKVAGHRVTRAEPPERRRRLRRLTLAVTVLLVPATAYLAYARENQLWPFAQGTQTASATAGEPQPPQTTAPEAQPQATTPQTTTPETTAPETTTPAGGIATRGQPDQEPVTGRGRARGWWLLAPLAPLLLLLLYEVYRLIFLRPAVLRGEEARSPFAVDGPRAAEPPFDPEELRRTARDAALRQRADTVRLSVPRTVAATVAAGGYPDFRYDALTRPSEYLVLVERRGARDQQARLADELCARLVAEGVILKRYFFDADPRVCYDEAGARGMGLGELHRDHPGARLLIVSDGRVLTDARSGELLSWTRALAAWADRALLTPEPVGRWGLPEAMIADELPVFPATLAGVRAAAEHFASDAEPDWYAWWERNQEEPAPAVPHYNSPETLRRYLGEEGYRWVCACAVYPELHWRLTLMVGSLPALGVQATERDLLRLVRLGWLRRGAIPNVSRDWLVRDLGDEGERVVRSALLDALGGEDEKAPENGKRAVLDRTVQQLFLHRDERATVRRLLRRLKRLPRAPLLEDVAAVRLLHRLSRSRLHLPLPERLARLVYQAGIPALGMRPWSRGLLCAVASALLWVVLPVFPTQAPAQEDQAGENTPPPAITDSVTVTGSEMDTVVTTTTTTVDTAQGEAGPDSADSTQNPPGGTAQNPTGGPTQNPSGGPTQNPTGTIQNPAGSTQDPSGGTIQDPSGGTRPDLGGGGADTLPLKGGRAFAVKNGHLIGFDSARVEFRHVPTYEPIESPLVLVLHTSVTGNLSTAEQVIRSAPEQASVHLLVDRDGRVVQLAPFDSATRHAGQSQWNGLTGLNRYSIALQLINWGRLERRDSVWVSSTGQVVPRQNVVEAVDPTTGAVTGWERYTDAQLQSVIGIYSSLRQSYPSLRDVVGHQDVSDNQFDPGPAFPMDRVRAAVLASPSRE